MANSYGGRSDHFVLSEPCKSTCRLHKIYYCVVIKRGSTQSTLPGQIQAMYMNSIMFLII